MVSMMLVVILTLLHTLQYEAKVTSSIHGAAMSCADHFKAGSKKKGYYSIQEKTSSKMLVVYCDFESEPGMAWTLAMSYSLINLQNMPGRPLRKALTVNMPINSRHPNWNVYRMSKASMNNLVLQSTHFRFTCNFKNYIKSSGFKDYLRAKLSSISPLTFSGAGLCRVVEYINIRDHSCANCRAQFWQNANWIFHTDSSHTGCDLRANQGAVNSEDNFGEYGFYNKKFTCTATPYSTTQLWFGGEI